ncbi:unnamed protein product, partial [Candidula unifasciata]
FKVRIDLNNLEDVKFENSKYVLTSPRSLDACSRLNVKPVELLYKPLSEFQEELLPQDIPLRTIYAIYDENEQIRQQKLRLCREERSRIMSEEPEVDKLGNKVYKSPASPGRYCSHLSLRHYKVKNILCVDNESWKLHREVVSKKEKSPTRSRQRLKTRPQSSDGKQIQRCSSSITLGKQTRFRCGSAPDVSYKLPARDEKILKLMQGRREEECKDLEIREHAHRLWEDQRRREEALRTNAENKRRELLAMENQIKNMHRLEAEEKRVQEEERERELKKRDIHNSQLHAESLLINQLHLRELQMADKIRKEAVKKEIQEINMKTKDKTDDAEKQLLLAKHIIDEESANERKEMKIHHESLKTFLHNRQEREKYEKRLQFLKNQEAENNALLKSAMEDRLTHASQKLSEILEQRNRQIAQQKQEEQAKLQKAQRTQKILEAEMEAWRSDLLQQEKMMEDRAIDVVNRSIELKSFQARKKRIVKELEQKKNISRLQKDDEKYRRSLERSLLLKDRKIEDLIDSKQKVIAQTRAVAQLSQTLRDDIKGKYDSDTFDKKILEAQLYANLNREHRTQSPAGKNRSSVQFC